MSEEIKVPEADTPAPESPPAEAPAEAVVIDDTDADTAEPVVPEGTPAPENVKESELPDAPVKAPDASHVALRHLLAEGELVTHEILDEIEKSADISHVVPLVHLCRALLDELEGKSSSAKTEEA